MGEWAALTRFDRWLSSGPFNWPDLTLELAEAWLDHGLQNTASAGNDFIILRDFYRYGANVLAHADFSAQLLLHLELLRAPGNAKGNAVRAGDANKGQLLPDEVESIYDALREGKGTPQQRASVWLCLDVGRNSGQYTQLENQDLICESVVIPGGAPKRLYQLAIPRQKKRTAERENRRWPISTELGDLLTSLQRGGPRDPLLWWIQTKYPEKYLNRDLAAWAKAVDLRSARVANARIRLNARRFRVTLLTNAADEGAPLEHLAMLADHTDTQNVRVYVERSPLFLERIRPKVNALYDPIVRRFSGQMAPEAELRGRSLPVIPGVATQLRGLAMPGIGACGKQGVCKLAPPLTCYPCRHFIAFADADHRAVERALAEHMQQLDERIALQIAPSLAAVREVISAQEARQPTPIGDEIA